MIQAPAFALSAAPRALTVEPVAPVRTLAVTRVAAIAPVHARPDLARFADSFNQASRYAADGAALRASWPEGGRPSTPPSAPADLALAALGTGAPGSVIEGTPPRAAAAAASRAYRAAAAAFA